MKVPLLDLKAQFAAIRGEVLPAVTSVLESQVFNIGPFVKELEKAVAEYSGCSAGVGVSSGTDAILAALMAIGVKEGDEVITTPFTFFATAGCIARLGARPVFVDIEAGTFNIDPSKIEKAITPRTKAILPVHLYGQMADMDAILSVAGRHGLPVIEDAAQAIGAASRGRKAGSMGLMGCLSFYPTKNLGGIGDGGMVLTQDKSLAARLEVMRDHGQSPTYFYKFIGGNFRLDNIQAAALAVKMRHLSDWTARRQAHAAQYDRLLAGCPGVAAPPVREGNTHVYNQYVIRTPRRADMQAFLKSHEIASGIYYPLCLHEQECFRRLGHGKGDFPVAEKAAAEVLALPACPELTEEQVAFVAAKVREFASQIA
jgi:dTDP-4-amino-4,6-dideoxygalactose transaminase